MFTATTSSDASFIDGSGTNFFYSIVMQVSNLTSLSTTGDYVMGMGDQGTIANQTSQPGTIGAVLYMKQVNTTNFVLGLAKQANQAAVYSSTVLNTNQIYFIVIDYEIIGPALYATGPGPSGDNVRLWINPATNTFGAPIAPTNAADTSIIGTGNSLTPYISCVQIYDHATDTPNDLYLTDFRMGTNWGWVTGGPAIALQPVASTNVATGTLSLSVTAMNNGSANAYNWQFNGVNLTNGPSISGSGANVSGAVKAILTINGMDTSPAQQDSGSYTVVVSNNWGAVTSSVSTVTASPAPIITVQPGPTNLLLYAGKSDTLSLTAGGVNLSYFWYSNNTLVPAVTGTNFIISNARVNATIYCVVSNSIGVATSSVVSLTVLPLPTAPYPLTVIDDYAIGFWPLNEGPDNGAGNDGTTAYDYAGGNDGVYTNVVLGQQGYAAGLAGQYGYTPPTDTNTSALFGAYATNNSYVAQIPNINFAAASNGSSFSVEAWVNGNGNTQTSGACIVGKGFGNGGEQFTMDYTTGWRFYVREAGGASVVAVSTNTADGNWHHLAGVLDTVQGSVTMYVDGVARSTTPYSASTGILSTALPVTIGSRQASAGSTFNDNFVGEIEDVAIYNYALTATQVSNHYDVAGIGASIATLPSQITVDENTTLTIAAPAFGTPPLAYQWYDVTSGSPGTALPGQTNATLVINTISAAAYNGHYLVLVVSNIYNQATSSSILIIVQSGPPNSVTMAPLSLTVYVGVAAPFTVTAQGTAPISYQWSTNGGNVAGATNSTYNAILPPGSYTIGCAVTNAQGPGSPSGVTASLTVVAAPSDFYGSTILKDTPVAFWRLDEPASAAVANDYVGNHDASYNNVVNGQPGFSPVLIPSETATVFGSNGTPNSVAIEINDTGNGIPFIDFSTQGGNAEFSVELWVQEPLQTMDLLCKGYPNNTQFALDGGGTGGTFRFVIHNGADAISAANGTAAPNGNWHHLVGVCDEANGKISLYVDSVLQGTAAVGPGSGLFSLASSTYPVDIGAQAGQGGNSFTGATNASLSQVALYAYALTSNQVAAHYAAAIALPPFSITSWTHVAGTSITLNWLSMPNYIYQVQVAAALSGGTTIWNNVGSPITATATNTSYIDTSTNATGKAGFYRVIGY
jgi:hypothetical protein